jgi:predicted cobalt transporter CbtA
VVGRLLLRGMLVGLFAGLLAFGIARVFGEPQVDRAIAFEEQEAQARHEMPEPELVSRETQAGIGLFTGVAVYSTALGGLFALVFAFVYGRVGRLDAQGTAALLALAGFVALVLVPGVKYPANPPAVGSAETIGYRTELYFVMQVLSLIAAAGAVTLARGLRARFGAWTACVAAGAVYLVAVIAVEVALPAINEVPESFSAAVLWDFRVAALGMQVVIWAVLGLAFGALAARVVPTVPVAAPARDGRRVPGPARV